LPDYVVSETVDTAQIRSYLMNEPDYAAYALGDLEPPYSEHACWIAALDREGIRGLALLYQGLEPTILFLMGEIRAVGQALQHITIPDDVFFTVKPSHRSVLEKHYDPIYLNNMYRMRVSAGSFKEPDTLKQWNNIIIPLDISHSAQIQELIQAAAAADSRELSDVAFSPDMLASGTYAGIFASQDRLIVVAGTHLIARRVCIAAVGNVVTHPDHRRQGLGTLVCHYVTRALLEDGFERVVLNVRQGNEPAIRIYQKLGYKMTDKFVEGMAIRARA
jgi:ribosomal protein S18 acetylase RimI-like enzyme